MSTFDTQKSVQLTADAQTFTATISQGTNVCRAELTYKPSFKTGPPSVVARDMDSLMSALSKQDDTVKFYRVATDGTAAAKDAAVLEKMRNDPTVRDVEYFRACRKLGAQPQVRQLQSVASPTTPKAVPALVESANAWAAFEQAHGELFIGPFATQNIKVIEAWFDGEQAQWTEANLATCYKELKALSCFRDARTLSRNLNGSLAVVEPYSRQRVLALRTNQVADARNEPPSFASDVEKDAWRAVHQKYPTLPVQSVDFQKCVRDTLLLWAKEYALEQNPELGATNAKGQLAKQGELDAAVLKVLNQWARISNPNTAKRTDATGRERVWLG